MRRFYIVVTCEQTKELANSSDDSHRNTTENIFGDEEKFNASCRRQLAPKYSGKIVSIQVDSCNELTASRFVTCQYEVMPFLKQNTVQCN